MIIAAISDLHGLLPPSPAQADIIVVAGDITRSHYLLELSEFAAWLQETMQNCGAKDAVIVAGNHDQVFAQAGAKQVQKLLGKKVHYLLDKAKTVQGLKFYGAPWVPIYGSWDFMLPPELLREKWAKIPEDTDVLVTHGPALGIGDYTTRGARAGCGHLLERIAEVQPTLHIFGHIHEGKGIYPNGKTRHCNVAARDGRYEVHARPWTIIEVPNV